MRSAFVALSDDIEEKNIRVKLQLQVRDEHLSEHSVKEGNFSKSNTYSQVGNGTSAKNVQQSNQNIVISTKNSMSSRLSNSETTASQIQGPFQNSVSKSSEISSGQTVTSNDGTTSRLNTPISATMNSELLPPVKADSVVEEESGESVKNGELQAKALRRAKYFMEESTLLKIVRSHLETLNIEEISGEAEGFTYLLRNLSFPSLDTCRSLCFLKHPDAVLSKEDLIRSMLPEVSEIVPSLTKSGNTRPTPRATINSKKHKVYSHVDNSQLVERYSLASFAIQIKNLGLILHHEWKVKGYLVDIEGENIVDVRNAHADVVFSLVKERLKSENNSEVQKTRFVLYLNYVEIELSDLDLNIVNHKQSRFSLTTLVLGTLRRIFRTVLRGDGLKERLQDVLRKNIAEKVNRPFAASEIQKYLPEDLVVDFLKFFQRYLPGHGVQL